MASTEQYSILERKMRAVIIAYMFFVLSSFALAQDEAQTTLGEIKRWRLSTSTGDIVFILSSVPNRTKGAVTTLALKPVGDYVPTSVEEAVLLGKVLHEMSFLGYDPTMLNRINTWLQNSEFQDGVAQAIAVSGKWKACVGKMYCDQAEAVSDEFLTSIDAFDKFDPILHEFGLKKKLVRVDGLWAGEVKDRVRCQGLIGIDLEREKTAS